MHKITIQTIYSREYKQIIHKKQKSKLKFNDSTIKNRLVKKINTLHEQQSFNTQSKDQVSKITDKKKQKRVKTQFSQPKSMILSNSILNKTYKFVSNNKQSQNLSQLNKKGSFKVRLHNNSPNKLAIKRKISQILLNIPVFQTLFQESKISIKPYGFIKSYSANTHKGIYRNSNEDRVSIIMNIPHTKQAHYFGIFDGHGGVKCADFLIENIFEQIAQRLPKNSDIKLMLENIFLDVEKKFINEAKKSSQIQQSGSCALISLIIQDNIYIANLGDSRALLINNNKVIQITEDHKPNSIQQKKRIQQAGGKISCAVFYTSKSENIQIGPLRVWPGGLSVSRTFGDISAKVQKYGGKRNVISVIPDIYHFKVLPETILILACDGIYDKLENQKIKQIFYSQMSHSFSTSNKDDPIVRCFQEAFERDCHDNVSMISICF